MGYKLDMKKTAPPSAFGNELTPTESGTQPARPSRLRNFSRRTLYVVASIFIVLVIFRLTLPFIVEKYVNHQLNRNAGYGGAIGDVSVSLWRGAYTIKNVNIFKRNRTVKEPFFESKKLDLSIEWNELLRGTVVGAIEMDEPRLNFVSGPTAAQTQTGKDVPWNQTLSSLFPFKLNRFEIKTGEVHFQNHYSKPPVDIYLNQLTAVATNLTNSRKLSGKLPAGLSAHCTTLGKGDLDLQLHLNSTTPLPTYEMVCELSNVDLVSLNDFLMAYGKFDVSRGKFELYASVASSDGKYEGYIKTFFQNLDVFKWQKEKNKTPLQVVWDGVVESAAVAFKNHPNDTLATKIPISGTYQKSEVGILSAIGNLLKNAFIQALVPKVDETMTVNKVQADTGSQSTPAPPVKPPK
jgi:Domain of Unknown Function (DUF748)